MMNKPDISIVTNLSKIDVLKDMTTNVEDCKTLLNQPPAIGTTAATPPTVEWIIFFDVNLWYSTNSSFLSGDKHGNVPNKSPNRDEVGVLNDPNFKTPRSLKSPREEARKQVNLEYT